MAEAYLIEGAVIQDPEDGEGYLIEGAVFQASEAAAGGLSIPIAMYNYRMRVT